LPGSSKVTIDFGGSFRDAAGVFAFVSTVASAVNTL